MSKELEYIEKMICWYEDNFSQLGKERNQEHIEQLNNIKQALQRLESIDNAKPSEVLEELEMLSDCAEAMKEAPSSNWIEYAKTDAELDLKLHFAYLDLKQYILKAQEQEKEIEILKEYRKDYLSRLNNLEERYLEQEKVLEIIFEKNVDIDLLKKCKTTEEYNYCINFSDEDKPISYEHPLAKEEFDLLKRYCK